MISFVTWKWHTKGSPRTFLSEHVNVLYAMVARWYPNPFRFICITDDPAGLDEKIEVMAMPVRFDTPSPMGARFPQCYARLWNFSREATILGQRILALDIDLIICGDLTPLVDRSEDFVGWCEDRLWNKIAGGIYLLNTGALTDIWDDFDPKISPKLALSAGNRGSDQAWMSYKLYPPQGRWTADDGLWKINWTARGEIKPPAGARVIFTKGVRPPWSKEMKKMYPWVKEYWRL